MRLTSNLINGAAAFAVAAVAAPNPPSPSDASNTLATAVGVHSAVINGAAAGALGRGQVKSLPAARCLSQNCLVSPSATDLRNQNCCSATVCNGIANGAGVIVGVCSSCVAAGNACTGPGECCGVNICLNMQSMGRTRRGVCGRPFTPSAVLPTSSPSVSLAPTSLTLPGLVPTSKLPLPSSTVTSSINTTTSTLSSTITTAPSSSSLSSSSSTTTTSTSSSSSSTTSSVVNLFLDPGFEDSDSQYSPPWQVNGGSSQDLVQYGVNQGFSSPAVAAHSGNNSLVIRDFNANRFDGSEFTIEQAVTVQAGVTYVFSMWIQATKLSGFSGFDPEIDLAFTWDGTYNVGISPNNGGVPLDGQWHQYSDAWTWSSAQTTTTGVYMWLMAPMFASSGPGQLQVVVDDFSLAPL